MQGGIERAVVDEQQVVGMALDRLANAVAVHRPEEQRAQDQEVERPLEQRRAGRGLGLHGRESTR
jgi:hypothetical protein